MSSYVSSNWRGTSQTPDNGPRAKCDQVVFEAIAKAAEIIVASRGGAPDPNSQSSTSSGRFNLQVPEIPGVRSILQRSRRALHVPLRLDVYYQHDDQGHRRELLERWCLEYVPCRLETFLEREGGSTGLTQDPIAQLRHVCKRIVIWLRTLYCWSRLLPAQGFRTTNGGTGNQQHNPIGFSVYVVSDGSDDVSDLVNNQGFSSQQQPSSVVTPYGELGWRAIYVDKSVVDRLLPPSSASRSPLWGPRLSTTTTAARPIPIQQSNGGRSNNKGSRSPKNTPGSNGNRGRGMVPQSAPAHLVDPEWHHTTEAKHESLQQYQNQHNQNQQQHQQQSYDPSNFRRRTHSTIDDSHYHPAHGPDLVRRNTCLGDERASPSMSQHATPSASAEKPPERVMSGLSLALMMSDERGNGEGGRQNGAAPTSDLATAEKRRAALHQLPPHVLMEQQSSQQAGAHSPGAYNHASTASNRRNQRPSAQGEYGYAYNNHIPWQRIHPSSTNATLGRSPSGEHYVEQGRCLSTSPSALASTPPSGAFLGPGTTPPVNSTSSQHFIPPRSSAMGSITPPFAPRPAGFSQQPPPPLAQPLPPMAEQPSDTDQQRSRYGDTLPPLASLDLLHSSPFQHAQGSLLSSLSLAPPAGGGTESGSAMMMMNSGDLRRSMWSASPAGGGSAAFLPSSSGMQQDGGDGDYDEMPFAVDESSSSQFASASHNQTTGTMNTGSTSQLGASSAAVASFAQKCAPSHRLKMFDSSIVAASATASTLPLSQQQPNQQDPDDMVNSLADQLAEFRNFGASLHVSSTTGGGGGGGGSEHDPGASSSTPITLRT
jgi:hypothetical protein